VGLGERKKRMLVCNEQDTSLNLIISLINSIVVEED
jgi:hypothetical protein